MLQPARRDRGLQFRQIEARAGDGNARADIGTLGDLLGEFFRGEMSPRIERDDFVRIGPLRERPIIAAAGYWSGQDA